MPSKVIPDMNRKAVGGRNQTFLNEGEKKLSLGETDLFLHCNDCMSNVGTHYNISLLENSKDDEQI